MNTINKSTGYTPFQLRFGHSPWMLPPVLNPPVKASTEYIDAREIIEVIARDVADAKDNLMLAKITQSHQVNEKRTEDVTYKPGDQVMLSTLNRRREYKRAGEQRVAKFMPHFDGPYIVTDVNPEASTVTLDTPQTPNLFPTFHSSHVKPFKPNDDLKFPRRTINKPGPIEVDGVSEHVVDKIIDCKKIGKKFKYLVRWSGYGPEDDEWIAGRDLENNEAMDCWIQDHPSDH